MSRWRLVDGLLHASWLGLAGLLLSCGPPPGEESRNVFPEVEYSGCWAVYLPGPVCALYPPDLNKKPININLWVRNEPDAEVEIRLDGRRWVGESEERKGGRLYKLGVKPRTSVLTVRLRWPDDGRGPIWTLLLSDPEKPGWLVEVEGLIQRGETAKARQRLAQVEKEITPKERGPFLRALSYLARMDGNGEKEAIYLEQGSAAHKAAHCLNGEIDLKRWLVMLHLDHGRFNDARQILDPLELPEGTPADSKYLPLYYRGVLAQKAGDFRSAVSALQDATDLAERVGLNYVWHARQVQAELLQTLGRTQEAADLYSQIQKGYQPEDPCEQATLLTNVAWSRLLSREGGEAAEDPTLLLTEAKRLYQSRCARPDQKLNARLNLAFAHLQAGRLPEAKEALREAKALAARPTLEQILWSLDLKARLVIADGFPKLALPLYDELDERASKALSLDGRFRASLGRAKALIDLHRGPEALDALTAADRFVDEQLRQVPMQAGLDTFLTVQRRQEAAGLNLQLLLEEGRHEEAFALVRRIRSRLLRQLATADRLTRLTPAEQKKWDEAISSYYASRTQIDREVSEQWSVPLDRLQAARDSLEAQLSRALADLDRALAGLGGLGEATKGPLSPPLPGEVVLTYYPRLEVGKWVGFAAHGREVDVSFIELSDSTFADPAALAQELLEPFQDVIEQAERVRVLSYGPLREVDFHALPFRGEPLLAGPEVVYSLDLPVDPLPAPPSRLIALVVADPSGQLEAAREEGKAVAAAVGTWGAGWRLHSLDGREARAEAVRQALPDATLFHYAGHSTSEVSGWDSELKLAGDSSLTPGDILALRRTPAWVVLASCVSGRSSEQAPSEGIGLAQAFLVAGSRGVIATTRPVDDRTGRDLLRELYRGWQPGKNLATQLRRAQLAYREQNPASDWASFRLLEP